MKKSRLLGVVSACSFSISIIVLLIPVESLASYVQADAIADGTNCFQPDFPICSGDTGQLQQDSTAITRSYHGSTVSASADLATQELKLSIDGAAGTGSNNGGSSFNDTYRFDPLTASAQLIFTYTFEGSINATGIADAWIDVQVVSDQIGSDSISTPGGIFLSELYDGTIDTDGSHSFQNVLNLVAGTSLLDMTMRLDGSVVGLGIVDVSNTADYSISFSTDFTSITRDSGLPVTAVPLPATLWLFGSGLLGLIGIARRKKTA